MSPLFELPETLAGQYRHYKGGLYEVLATVRHSETTQPMVLYRALYGDQGLWVRPYAMFFENVSFEGHLQPRFQRLGNGNVSISLDDRNW